MNAPTVSIIWKVVSLLEQEPSIYEGTNAFKVYPNVRLYKDNFRIPLNLCYVPHRFAPTITFHRSIKKLIKDQFGIVLKYKGFPYTLPLLGLDDTLLRISEIRLYLPRIVSLTVELSQLPNTLDADQLISYQYLIQDTPVSDIIRWTIGIVESLDCEDFNPFGSFISKPLLHLGGICTAEAFQNHFNSNTLKYIGILIRNRHYKFMAGYVPERIISKNRELNTKSSELLLVDKQGILYLTPSDTSKVYSRSEILFLCEMAFVIEMFLDNYSQFRTENEDFSDFILHKIIQWIRKDNTIISRSVSHQAIWNLMCSEFVKSSGKFLTDKTILECIEQKSRFFEQITNAWWEVEDFPSILSRAIARRSGLDLSFLKNETLIDIILQDYREAQRSLTSRNYKATVVLCGSILEAILTAVLEQRTKISVTKLASYGLYDLIMEANQQRLITDNDLLSQLNTLRHYRNIIHPQVQERKGFEVDEHKAVVAIRYIHILVDHFSKTL